MVSEGDSVGGEHLAQRSLSPRLPHGDTGGSALHVGWICRQVSAQRGSVEKWGPQIRGGQDILRLGVALLGAARSKGSSEGGTAAVPVTVPVPVWSMLREPRGRWAGGQAEGWPSSRSGVPRGPFHVRPLHLRMGGQKQLLEQVRPHCPHPVQGRSPSLALSLSAFSRPTLPMWHLSPETRRKKQGDSLTPLCESPSVTRAPTT